jgi:hypothetical protein
MKFEFPKVIRTIALKDYAPEMGDGVVEVWVNPPRSTWLKMFEISAEIQTLANGIKKAIKEDQDTDEKVDQLNKKTQELFQWYVEIWGQGSEDHRPTLEQVEELAKQETDPAFYPWITRKTLELIRSWRSDIKKG